MRPPYLGALVGNDLAARMRRGPNAAYTSCHCPWPLVNSVSRGRRTLCLQGVASYEDPTTRSLFRALQDRSVSRSDRLWAIQDRFHGDLGINLTNEWALGATRGVAKRLTCITER